MNRLLRIFLIALCLLTGVAAPASLKLTVQYPRGRDYLQVGDKFYMTINVEGQSVNIAKPDNVPGAQVLYWLSQSSSSVTSQNGHMVRTEKQEYNITLMAVKAGKYSFSVNSGGQKTNTVTYTIREASANPPQGSGAQPGSSAAAADDDDDGSAGPKFIGQGDNNLFMRAQLSKTTAYEQEALVYTVKLYTTYPSVKFIGATATPAFDGFLVEQSKVVDNALRLESYQGKEYQTAVIARYIIFPQKSGTLQVTGNTYTVSVEARNYYHDRFFGTMSYGVPLQLNITPNTLQVNVKPLPQPQPADFSGGVGHFNISSDLPSAELKTNQAAPITYTVTGSGNLRYVKLPELQQVFPQEIEVYSPTVDVKAVVGRDDVSGSVSFEYSMMPSREGTFTLPPVKLVYFNPATGQYETSSSRSYQVKVGAGEASEKSQTRKKLEFQPALQQVKGLSNSFTPAVYTFRYWIWFWMPACLLVVVYLLYLRHERMIADMEGLRSRRAAKIASKWLKKADAFAKAGKSREFFESLLTAIWGYLGDKLKIRSSELSRKNVGDVLLERGVPQEQVDSLIGLIDNAEMAHYANVAADFDMRGEVTRAAGLLDDINQSLALFNKRRHEARDGETMGPSAEELRQLRREIKKQDKK